MKQTSFSSTWLSSRVLLVASCLLLRSKAFHPPSNSGARRRHNGVIGSGYYFDDSRACISTTTVALGMSAIRQNDFNLEKLEKGLTEMHRRDRRDFYNNEAWIRHRSSSRFFDNLRKIPASKAVLMIAMEVSAITAISFFLIMYNHLLVIGYVDLSNVYHPPLTPINFPLLSLPKEPLVLSSPALALLLVFRTNVCWARWDEARKAWGAIVNNCRSIVRKTSSWIMESDLPYEEKQRLLSRVADTVWAFPRAEQRHLLSEYEDEANFVADVKANLKEPFASDLIKYKRHRPSFVLFEMTCALNELPLDMFRRCRIDEATSELCNAMGACDRLYTSPIPKIYNRHTSRFLSLWLVFLPLTLWESLGEAGWNHTYLPIISSAIALGMLGIELISMMLEEPFSLLPLKNIVNGIGKSAEEHLEYNVFETFDRPKVPLDEKLKRYISDDYNSPEYMEAMSMDTVIRHQHLGKPVVESVGQSALAASTPQAVNLGPRPVETSPASEWNYLARAAASIEENLNDIDKVTERKIDMLRDIETNVRKFEVEGLCP